MYAALVVGEFYPVRIVSGTTKNGRHAQAQAYIASAGVWLDVSRETIWEAEQDRFTPDKTYTVGEYFNKTFNEMLEEWGPECLKLRH